MMATQQKDKTAPSYNVTIPSADRPDYFDKQLCPNSYILGETNEAYHAFGETNPEDWSGDELTNSAISRRMMQTLLPRRSVALAKKEIKVQNTKDEELLVQSQWTGSLKALIHSACLPRQALMLKSSKYFEKVIAASRRACTACLTGQNDYCLHDCHWREKWDGRLHWVDLELSPYPRRRILQESTQRHNRWTYKQKSTGSANSGSSCQSRVSRSK